MNGPYRSAHHLSHFGGRAGAAYTNWSRTQKAVTRTRQASNCVDLRISLLQFDVSEYSRSGLVNRSRSLSDRVDNQGHDQDQDRGPDPAAVPGPPMAPPGPQHFVLRLGRVLSVILG